VAVVVLQRQSTDWQAEVVAEALVAFGLAEMGTPPQHPHLKETMEDLDFK